MNKKNWTTVNKTTSSSLQCNVGTSTSTGTVPYFNCSETSARGKREVQACLDYIECNVSDPDPYGECGSGSRSKPKLTSKPIPLHTYIKNIFHVKIQLFVTTKSDQNLDLDPHWFGSLDPDPAPHWGKSWIRNRIRIGSEPLLEWISNRDHDSVLVPHNLLRLWIPIHLKITITVKSP